MTPRWDQRGAGRTYAGSDPNTVAQTMSISRLVDDAEALAAHLRRSLGQERIVVMGHSFGSVIGTELARRRPRWLHAYVGVGQVVAMRRSERLGFEAILADAHRRRGRELAPARQPL